jgi:hypothetical protein
MVTKETNVTECIKTVAGKVIKMVHVTKVICQNALVTIVRYVTCFLNFDGAYV